MKQLSLVTLIIGVTATGAAAAAGDQGAAPAPPPIQRPAPDFLFGEPNGSVGIRGSWVFARAGSDIFDFVRDRLTVDEGAFNAPAIGTDVAIAINPRLDAVFAPIALPPALAAAAPGGQNADPRDPIFTTFGDNYLKIRLRSHRDVALAHYADVDRT